MTGIHTGDDNDAFGFNNPKKKKWVYPNGDYPESISTCTYIRREDGHATDADCIQGVRPTADGCFDRRTVRNPNLVIDILFTVST